MKLFASHCLPRHFAQGEHHVSLMPWVCDTQNKGPECEGGSGYGRDGDDGSGYCRNGCGGSSEYKGGDSENRGIQVMTAEVMGT